MMKDTLDMHLSPKRLAEIRERLEKATPGPWGLHMHPTVRPLPIAIWTRAKDGGPGDSVMICGDKNPDHYANWVLAAHAPTDISDLLDGYIEQAAHIKRLEARRRKLLP